MTPNPTSLPHSCKQNQDLLSFYAVVMGLDNAAVSRLRLTWEVRRPLPSLPTVVPPQDLCVLSGLSGSFWYSLLLLLLCGESLCHWEAGAFSWSLLCPRVCKLVRR